MTAHSHCAQGCEQPGDDGENRLHEPGHKAWGGNFLLEFDQQARYGGQLPHPLTNRALCAGINRRNSRK